MSVESMASKIINADLHCTCGFRGGIRYHDPLNKSCELRPVIDKLLASLEGES